MTTYRLTVPQLIVELRKWARARDRVNQKPNREGRPLSSDPLLEAANRLEDYYNQDDPERLLNYQERRELRYGLREEYVDDPHKLAEIHRDEKEASS